MKIGEDKKIKAVIRKLGRDILVTESFQSEVNYIQHGEIDCYEHSLAVTYMCVYLARKFRLRVDLRSVVRGALLHDYFLYDWHDDVAWHRLHGYHHARTSLITACKDFPMNRTEKQIIFRHMFPLNISRFPNSKEAAMVCMADKICATLETIRRKRYDPVIYKGLKLPIEVPMTERGGRWPSILRRDEICLMQAQEK